MGIYLNPGNSGFQEIRNSRYVDKSGLISLINRTIGTKQKLTCVSRPRRFGKSFAAQMLCAYYDKGCDSSDLFCDLAIAVDKKLNGSYQQHLNKYDVIYLDMTNIMGKAAPQDILSFIENGVTEELLDAYPELKAGRAFDETLLLAAELTGNKFIRLIDEWDAPIREGKDNFTQIAKRLQYSTVHHFSRQFKEYYGITPTQYAKSIHFTEGGRQGRPPT